MRLFQNKFQILKKEELNIENSKKILTEKQAVKNFLAKCYILRGAFFKIK